MDQSKKHILQIDLQNQIKKLWLVGLILSWMPWASQAAERVIISDSHQPHPNYNAQFQKTRILNWNSLFKPKQSSLEPIVPTLPFSIGSESSVTPLSQEQLLKLDQRRHWIFATPGQMTLSDEAVLQAVGVRTPSNSQWETSMESKTTSRVLERYFQSQEKKQNADYQTALQMNRLREQEATLKQAQTESTINTPQQTNPSLVPNPAEASTNPSLEPVDTMGQPFGPGMNFLADRPAPLIRALGFPVGPSWATEGTAPVGGGLANNLVGQNPLGASPVKSLIDNPLRDIDPLAVSKDPTRQNLNPVQPTPTLPTTDSLQPQDLASTLVGSMGLPQRPSFSSLRPEKSPLRMLPKSDLPYMPPVQRPTSIKSIPLHLQPPPRTF